MRVGVIASAVMSFLIVTHFRKYSLALFNSTDWIILLYITYSTFSVVWFTVSGMPLSVFIREYSNTVLPVFFYYFGLKAHRRDSKFYEITLKSLVVSFAITLVLFFQMPYFYRLYLYNQFGIGTNIILSSQYYHGLYGVTATGSLGVIGMLLSYAKIVKKKSYTDILGLTLCIVASVLTFRRSALYTGIFSIIVIHYLSYFKFRLLRYRYLVYETILVIAFGIYTISNHPELLQDLGERIMMVSQAFSERSESWFIGLNYASNLIIGDGLGVYGHKVVAYSERYISDGYFFRLIAELGIIGVLLLSSIVVNTLIKQIRNLEDNYIEAAIIVVILLQCIGSDTLSFQIIAPIFWYTIGYSQNKTREKTHWRYN